MNNLWQLINLNAVQPEPWRNGGGTTQALLAWPSLGDWRVRCSVATVAAAGPFSTFEGVQRWFAVLHGAGVVLNIAGQSTTQTQFSPPLNFDGGAATDCTLIDGDTQDFNLMLRGCTGRMQALSQQHMQHVRAGQWLAVYSHGHDTWIEQNGHDGNRINVPAQHLAWLHGAADCTLTITTHQALWMQADL